MCLKTKINDKLLLYVYVRIGREKRFDMLLKYIMLTKKSI